MPTVPLAVVPLVIVGDGWLLPINGTITPNQASLLPPVPRLQLLDALPVDHVVVAVSVPVEVTDIASVMCPGVPEGLTTIPV